MNPTPEATALVGCFQERYEEDAGAYFHVMDRLLAVCVQLGFRLLRARGYEVRPGFGRRFVDTTRGDMREIDECLRLTDVQNTWICRDKRLRSDSVGLLATQKPLGSTPPLVEALAND